MGKKVKIRVKKPWIGYPGTPIQQNYAENLEHGYFLWNIKSAKDHSVKFEELPNERPYVSIEWKNDVDLTLADANIKPGARIRVISRTPFSQVDAQRLSLRLKEYEPTEITFKDDQKKVNEFVVTFDSGKTLQRTDLRHVGNLVDLIREYHGSNADDVDIKKLTDTVSGYMTNQHLADEMMRNVCWSLKRVEFDNTFGFGENNVVDISKLNGIVGIFGQNTAGKSSFVGTILYGLFNSTDRGSLKNLHVINVRKDFCRAKSYIDVNGVQYQIERQSTKVVTKRGTHAPTHLNVHKVEKDGSLTDLVGEDRKDTERVVKRLIGTVDDYTLTSLSPQGSVSQFIEQGSTRRLAHMSRFMDLDIFGKMYDLANKDANVIKSQLKSYVNLDDSKIDTYRVELNVLNKKIETLNVRKPEVVDEISRLQNYLANVKSSTVDINDVKSQEKTVTSINDMILSLNKSIVELKDKQLVNGEKLSKLEKVLAENDLSEIREKRNRATRIEHQISAKISERKSEETLLKHLERSLHILDDVPCGDKFPACKFIKDAYLAKPSVLEKKALIAKLSDEISALQSVLQDLGVDEIDQTIEKIEKLKKLEITLKSEYDKNRSKIELYEHQIETSNKELLVSQKKLSEIIDQFNCVDNENVNNDRKKLTSLKDELKNIDDDLINCVAKHSRIQSNLERLEEDVFKRDDLNDQLRVLELISVAFAKKGLPQKLLVERLPFINEEIAKILNGVVDFTIEMEIDQETDDLEIYINYGDSKRIIELGSGMEKMISSLAIRVALTNVSTLPKSDVFVIDEGFGALDAQGIEACSRLLRSFNHYFRLIMFVTHVDGLKDVADHVIDISRQEKNSKVVFEP